jgi:hypothetical protein
LGAGIGATVGATACAAGNAINNAVSGLWHDFFTSRGKNDNQYSLAAKAIKAKGGDPCTYLDGLYRAARAANDSKTAQAVAFAQKIMGCRGSRQDK